MTNVSVIVCYFAEGSRLMKEKNQDGPKFIQRAQINGEWQTLNEWDDPGHVANLLMKAGYESEHLPAIKLLNIL